MVHSDLYYVGKCDNTAHRLFNLCSLSLGEKKIQTNPKQKSKNKRPNPKSIQMKDGSLTVEIVLCSFTLANGLSAACGQTRKQPFV